MSEEAHAAKSRTALIRQWVSTFLLFHGLSEHERQTIAAMVQWRLAEQGETISHVGAEADGLYFVYEGTVQIKHFEQGRFFRSRQLSQNSFWGERALINDFAWDFEAVVKSPKAALIFLPKEAFRRLLEGSPSLAVVIQENIALLDLQRRFASLLGGGGISLEWNELIPHIGVKKIPKGHFIYRQGDQDPRLYLIEYGRVELIRLSPTEEEPLILKEVDRGAIIGLTSALAAFEGKARPHAESARAVIDTIVLVVQTEAVRCLLEQSPSLHTFLKDQLAELDRLEREMLEASRHREGFDLRVRLADAITEEEFRAATKRASIGRFPFVRQQREEECLAACLTMVARFYGKSFTLGQIQELTNLYQSHPPINTIIDAAERLGFSARAYALKFEDLQVLKLPAIVGWEGTHFVILYQVSRKKVRIADPETGMRELSREEFTARWTPAVISRSEEEERGLVIALTPTPEFHELETPPKPLKRFLSYLLPYKKYFIEATLAAIVVNLLGLASPIFVQTIIDKVIVHRDASLLNTMLIGMGLVALLTFLVSAAQRLLLAYTTARIDLHIVSDFYRHLLSLPMSFFLSRSKGEILSRFGENQKIRNLITGSGITFFLNILMILIYLAMLFLYSFQLTLIVLAFVPLFVALTLYFTPKIKALSQKIFATNAQQQSSLIESLNAIETLKATANEYFARARWENNFVDNVYTAYRLNRLHLMSRGLNQLLSVTLTVLLLWMGAHRVMAGEMTIGELMGFNMLVGLLMTPIQQMVGLWNSFKEIEISLDRVSDILNVKPEQPPVVDPASAPRRLETCRGRIEFEHVYFHYTSAGKQNEIMRDFNLVIEPGQWVAFVGPSGCGKSTIAKMILGFNLPKQGVCSIDGIPLQHLDFRSLRCHVGIVLQDGFLFSGTVAENIALGDPQPDMAWVKEVARIACADEFIQNYPSGYQTPLGEKGIAVSGGQRQRICIARMLYRRPQVVILDEATSALDNDTEKRVMANLRAFLRGKTVIVIAHRLSTIIDVDMICYIAEGRVQEQGRHEELIDPDYLRSKGYRGLYYQLAASQFKLPPLDL